MVSLETTAKVRRDHFVHAKSIKQISRERGIGRNSVRKILRSGETTTFRYERHDTPMPKLGTFIAQLDTMLEANEKRAKRDRYRLTRIFDDLRREGYEGGYDAVRRYAQRWRRQRNGGVSQAFVPLYFAPGEAFQFDWSHEWVVMDGVTTKVKVAHSASSISVASQERHRRRSAQLQYWKSHLIPDACKEFTKSAQS